MINPSLFFRFSMIFFCVFCAGSVTSLAQRQLDHWIFGNQVHLDFSTGNPVQVAGTTLNAAEGSAVMSDAAGNLLFYTNGQTVWTAAHTAMPNGNGLQGHFSGSQNSLIIPVPGSTTRYYIFTNGHHNDNLGIQYSIVDMTLNGGSGDVTATKNVVLLPGPTTEKLTAVKHCNGTDFWVLTRRWNSTEFLAYHVTSAGISATPVISNSTYNLTTLSSTAGVGTVGRIGYMKASPAGTRIATFHCWTNTMEVAEFDPWTGQFSNILVMPAVNPSLPLNPVPNGYAWAYTGEFSPNGRYLYVMTNYWNSGMGSRASTLIYQFDVSSMNAATIESTRYLLDSFQCLDPSVFNGAGAVQIANNGKLYIAPSWRTSLSIVHAPNMAGAACNYQNAGFTFTSGNVTAGLPNFFPYFLAFYTTSDFSFTGNCDSLNVLFSFNDPSNADSLIWDFGDPASGSSNTSRLDTVSHRFSNYGLYTVKLIVHKKTATVCHNPIDTIVKQVFIPHLDIGNDTSLCSDSLRLPLNPVTFPGGSYLWNTGDTTPSILTQTSGTFWLSQTQYGCTIADTIEVDLNGDPSLDLGNDISICDTDIPVILSASPSQPPGTQYVWSTGLTSPSISVSQSGTYWLHVQLNGCSASDTINVNVVPVPVVSLMEDTTICEQWPLRIGTVIAGATYSWNTGETTPYIDVSETGDYILSVDLDGCVVEDAIHITAMPAPEIDLGDDGDICPEQTIVLDGSYGSNSRYMWSTGDTTSSVSVTEEGTYSVTVTTEHRCVGGDTITLSYYPKPTVSLPADTIVCEETPLRLPAWALNADSLLWSDGSYGNSLMIRYGGEYIVTAINKCGTESDTIEVKQIFCDIWLPNVFTPNGDGLNDVFRILGNLGRLEGVTFSVYNRWGERVFVTNDKLQGWDGYYKGAAAQLGTYVYLLQYSLDGRPYTLKGNFHLLR